MRLPTRVQKNLRLHRLAVIGDRVVHPERITNVLVARRTTIGEGQRWIELKVPPGADTRVALFTPKGQEDQAAGPVPA